MHTTFPVPPTSARAHAPERLLALISLAVATLSLVLSLLTYVSAASDSDIRSVEERLACLELPGANPCGPAAGR